MPRAGMGRGTRSESVNFLLALRGLNLPPLLVHAKWRRLCIGGRGGLAAVCTLIGAGAVGALLALKYPPNLEFASKFSSKTGQFLSEEFTNKTPMDEEELRVPGLQNAGNNCFLNVILQALASSNAFVSFITACAAVSSKVAMTSLATCSKDPVSMPLAISMSALMKELSELGKPHCTLSPRGVMLALRSYVRHFDMASQQDAAEALVHLTSAIQEERDIYLQWLKPTLQSFGSASLILEEDFPNAYEKGLTFRRQRGDQLLETWRGNLHWPLEGTLASFLTCQRCSYQYTTQIQFFNDISLSPLQDKQGNIIEGCTLEDCLEQFTGPEWVDSVKCSNCSHEAAVLSMSPIIGISRQRTSKGPAPEEHAHVLQGKLKIIEQCTCDDDDCGCESLTREQGGIWKDVHANASKQLKIGRSPEVICFQIQRAVMSPDGALKKLLGHVSFPKVLDLFPFTIAAESSPQTKDSSTKQEFKASLLSIKDDSHVVSQPSWLEAELVCKGLADLKHQKKKDTPQVACLPEKEHLAVDMLSTDLIEPLQTSNWADTNPTSSSKTDEAFKQSESSGGQLFSKQGSWSEISFLDSTPISSLLPSSSVSVRTFSPVASSICPPYVPSVLGPQLRSLSLFTPQGEPEFCLSSTIGRSGNMPALNSVHKITKRSTISNSTYSKRLLYDLVSVVVHQGGAHSGHYIVYRKVVLPKRSRSPALKEFSSLSSPTDVQRLNDKVKTFASSEKISHLAAPLQAGADEVKSQAGACPVLEPKVSTDKMFDDQSTVPVVPLQDLRGHKRYDSDTGTQLSVHEIGGDGSGVVNHFLEKPCTKEKLIAVWFRVSDTHVQRVSEHEVFSARASLLFYEHL